MSASEIIVMLARARSGTNALRSVLGSHPDILCLSEVFDLGERTSAHEFARKSNFFNFLADYAAADVTKTFADRHDQLFRDYAAFLRGLTNRRYVVIDIKYTSMHHLHAPFATFDRPYLFDLIVANGLRVLNLKRTNYLRYELSQQKAMATGQWECEGAAVPVDEAIALDIPRLLYTLKVCEKEDGMIREHLGGYAQYFACEYEDAFPTANGGVAAPALERIAAWLGIPATFVNEPDIRKQSYLPLPRAIRNFDEVAAALRGTSFEYCLIDERSYGA